VDSEGDGGGRVAQVVHSASEEGGSGGVIIVGIGREEEDDEAVLRFRSREGVGIAGVSVQHGGGPGGVEAGRESTVDGRSRVYSDDIEA